MNREHVAVVAEWLLSGRQVTASQLQRQAQCTYQYAEDLLSAASKKAEEMKYVQQTQKQAQINARHQAERRANSNAARRNRR